MPTPTSKRQFRFLQIIAHRIGRAKKKGLSAKSAKQGLAEFKAQGGRYKSLPASKGK